MDIYSSILLVDDDDIANFISTTIIERSNRFSHVETTISAEEALQYLHSCIAEKKTLPNYILLDINMPILSGWDFLDKLEGDDIDFSLKFHIYLLSSSQNPEDKKRAEVHPLVKGFLHKPLSFEEFMGVLN